MDMNGQAKLNIAVVSLFNIRVDYYYYVQRGGSMVVVLVPAMMYTGPVLVPGTSTVSMISCGKDLECYYH
jgi:hypothetical protein